MRMDAWAGKGPAIAASTGLVIAAVLALTQLGISGTGSPSAGSKSFVLNACNESVSVSFPNCADVKVTWKVTIGGPSSFGVWPPADRALPSCSGPPPSNAQPPLNWTSAEPGPVCYESGLSGICTFTADQDGYGLWAFGPWEGHAWAPIGNASVSVTVDWS